MAKLTKTQKAKMDFLEKENSSLLIRIENLQKLESMILEIIEPQVKKIISEYLEENDIINKDEICEVIEDAISDLSIC